MESSLVTLLESIKGLAVTVAVVGFIAVNALAIGGVLLTRSRAVVQRWTSPWLAANLLLVGTGIGVPVAASLCKSVVQVVASAVMAEAPRPLD